MSGHSKWSTIKHKKAITDAKRSKIFTQMARAITVAAQSGGGDPDTNFMLRMAIDQARAVNVPKDNILRAIKRGTGELKDGCRIETVVYEAMGPGGVAMLILCNTDNTNRTVSDVKTALKKNGGKFVSGGGVRFQFSQVGQIAVETDKPEEIELTAIDAGAEDIMVEKSDGKPVVIIITEVKNLQSVKESVESCGCKIADARITYVPKQTVELSNQDLTSYKQLREALEDVDDISEIYDTL